MSFGERVGRGVLWNQLSRVVEFGASYLASILAARALQATAYGTYSVAVSAVTFSYFLTSFGLNEVLNVHVPRLRGAPGRIAFLLRTLLGIRTATSIAMGAGLFFGAGAIAARYHDPALEPALRAVSLYAIAYGFSQLLEYFHIGILDVPRLSRVRMSVQLAGLAAAWAALNSGWRADQLLLALGVIWTFGVLWLAWGARRWLFGPGEPFDLSGLRTFGLTIWLANLVGFFLSRQADLLVIGYFRPGTPEAGCYAAATLLATILAGFLLLGTEGVTLAAFSDISRRIERPDVGRLWALHVKLDVLLQLPFIAFGIICAREIVAVLYPTPDFAPTVALLVTCCAFWAGIRPLGGGTNMTVIYSLDRPRIPLLLYAVAGTFNLVANIFLVQRYGALGAAIGSGITQIGLGAASSLFVTRETGVTLPWASHAKSFAAVGAAALAAALVPRPGGLPGLVVAGAVGLVVCLAALKLLRPLDDDDRRLLARLHPRLGAIAARLT